MGSTNLSGGWLKGLELLTTAPRAESLRRIIVLTDGHANAGITGADQLVQLIKGGYGQGVTTSCIGFDAGYDEQLLAALADSGMGNDYWCAGPDQAARVFADEFGGLAAVVAQNVSVEITPSAAVAATAVLNEFPTTALPTGVQVALGDAYGGERRKLVARFHLRRSPPPGRSTWRPSRIRWAATTGDVALHTVTVPVVVSAGNGAQGDPGASQEVTEEVLRLEVAKASRDARARGPERRLRHGVTAPVGRCRSVGIRDGNAKRGRGIASRRCSAPGRPLVGSRIEASVLAFEAPTRAGVPTTRRRKNQPEHLQSSVTNDHAASGFQHSSCLVDRVAFEGRGPSRNPPAGWRLEACPPEEGTDTHDAHR